MKLISHYFTKNPYATDGRYITGKTFKGFFLHSVGTPQPDPLVFIRGWDKESYDRAGINGFIGAEAVYLTAPCLDTVGKVKRMPHAGVRATNDSYIGFEMCEPSTIRYTSGANFIATEKAAAQAYVKSTYQNAVTLFAQLCSFHGKNPLEDGVILSHAEGAKRGVASNHADPEHLWRGLDMGYTMDGFRRDVANALRKPLYRIRRSWEDAASQLGAYQDKQKAIAVCPEGYSVFDEKGRLVFRKEEDMTQEKFNEMLAQAMGINGTGDTPSRYAEEACQWAKQQGIFEGDGNGNYGWQLPITREQAAVTLYRYAKEKKV